MIKYFFTIFFSIIFLSSIAQIESKINIWYFGTNAGIDFNYGVPHALEDGAMVTGEGCATACDEDGNLLFYTDGQTVWDKQHSIMPNGTGLMGNFSASQSGIIVPYPDSTNLFYIFTVDAWQNNLANGLRYSVVNMDLNGGLGDITSVKNIHLKDLVCEKIAAVTNTNEHDIWVIAHGWNNDEFYSYKITNSGINTTPVISSVGSSHSTNTGYKSSIGYMNISPNRNKIAVAIRDLEKVEVFDINRTSGLITNPISIDVDCDDGVYGVDFSNNSNVIYVSTHYCGIYQYDISSWDETTVQNSEYNIPNNSVELGAIQLGPNGKMYVIRKLIHYVGVIDYPNELGNNCNYIEDGLYLGTGECYVGLPTQFYYKGFNFFTGSEADTTICEGDSIFLQNNYQFTTDIYYDTLTNDLGWDSIVNTNLTVFQPTTPTISENNGILTSSYATNYQWYLNDTIIIGATNQQYQPTENGLYQVAIEYGNGCTSFSEEFNFTISGINIKEYSYDIYPNPFKNSLNINLNTIFGIKIIDINGKIMCNYTNINKRKTIDTSNLNNGVYLIKITTENKIFVSKIIKL